MEEDKIELFLKDYEKFKKYKGFIKDIDTNFFFEFADYMITKNNELAGRYQANSISKDKVKENIEEINTMIQKISSGYLQKYTVLELIIAKKFLQELLEL